MQEKHVTPDHYEVSVMTEESTPVSGIARKYLVIAPSAEAAEAHVQTLHPEGRILDKTLHRTEWTRTFEVAGRRLATLEETLAIQSAAEADDDEDEEQERPCGCPADYHMADCPILTDR